MPLSNALVCNYSVVFFRAVSSHIPTHIDTGWEPTICRSQSTAPTEPVWPTTSAMVRCACLTTRVNWGGVWCLQIFFYVIGDVPPLISWGIVSHKAALNHFPAHMYFCPLTSRWRSKLLSQQFQCPRDPGSLRGIKVQGLSWCGPLQQLRWG